MPLNNIKNSSYEFCMYQLKTLLTIFKNYFFLLFYIIKNDLQNIYKLRLYIDMQYKKF